MLTPDSQQLPSQAVNGSQYRDGDVTKPLCLLIRIENPCHLPCAFKDKRLSCQLVEIFYWAARCTSCPHWLKESGLNLVWFN